MKKSKTKKVKKAKNPEKAKKIKRGVGLGLGGLGALTFLVGTGVLIENGDLTIDSDSISVNPTPQKPPRKEDEFDFDIYVAKTKIKDLAKRGMSTFQSSMVMHYADEIMNVYNNVKYKDKELYSLTYDSLSKLMDQAMFGSARTHIADLMYKL